MSEVLQPVTIRDVTVRDGLQDLPDMVPTADKVNIVQMTQDTGVRWIEIAGFSHPRAMPQHADAEDVTRRLTSQPRARYTVYAPNAKGARRALDAGARVIYMGTASNDEFLQALTEMNVDESLAQIEEVGDEIERASARLGVYISDSVSERRRTPYEIRQYRDILQRLRDAGATEFAVCDSEGTATEPRIREMLDSALEVVHPFSVVAHFHDRNGNSIENAFTAYNHGVRIFDATLLGLGGCPAVTSDSGKGNMPIETFVVEAENRSIKTGIDNDKLMETSFVVMGLLGFNRSQIHSPAFLEYLDRREAA